MKEPWNLIWCMKRVSTELQKPFILLNHLLNEGWWLQWSSSYLLNSASEMNMGWNQHPADVSVYSSRHQGSRWRKKSNKTETTKMWKHHDREPLQTNGFALHLSAIRLRRQVCEPHGLGRPRLSPSAFYLSFVFFYLMLPPLFFLSFLFPCSPSPTLLSICSSQFLMSN